MNYKISGAIRRTRKYYIIFAILWVFISIVLVMPLTIGFHEAQIQHNISKGFEVIIDSIQHLGKSFGILSSQKIWGDYLKNVGLFTIFYAILMTIGLIRSAPSTYGSATGKRHAGNKAQRLRTAKTLGIYMDS